MILKDLSLQFANQQYSQTGVFIKNTSHEYQYINETLANVMQKFTGEVSSQSCLLLHKDDAIFPKLIAEDCMDSDKRVYQGERLVKVFETFTLNKKQSKYAVTYKEPIYEGCKIVGLLGKIHYLNVFEINKKEVILSERELVVLTQICFGLSMKEIAHRIGVSVGTVSTYINRIKVKLDVYHHHQLLNVIHQNQLATPMLDYLSDVSE